MQVAVVTADIISSFNTSLGNSTNKVHLGPVFYNKLRERNKPWSSAVSWKFLDSTPKQTLVDYVEIGVFWAVVYIPQNFSSDFSNHLTADPMQTASNVLSTKDVSIEVIFDQARAYSATSLLISTIRLACRNASEEFFREAGETFTTTQAPLYIHNGLYLRQVVVKDVNLHPVEVFGHNLAANLIFFVMWLGSSLAVTVFPRNYYQQYIEKTEKVKEDKLKVEYSPIKQDSLAVLDVLKLKPTTWMIISPVLKSLLMTFAHTLAGWAILFTLTGSSLPSPFILFLLLYITTLPTVFVSLFMYGILPAVSYGTLTSMFIVLNLTSSGSLLDHIQMPAFFQIGLALPMRHAIRIYRYHFFGTGEARLMESGLVLGAWTLFSAIGYVVSSYFKIRREIKAAKKFNS